MRYLYISLLLIAANPGVVFGQIISTFAGNGTQGYSGDGGQSTLSNLNNPISVTLDAAGNIYIADQTNNRIRKVNPSGVITTIAGNGANNSSGDGGQAIAAGLYNPDEVAIDALGNLYIADEGNNRIRMINTSEIITTIAGNGTNGFSGDGGQANLAELKYPEGLTLDALGNLYIADTYNNCIRKVSTSGIITTVAGNSTAGYSGDLGQATLAELNKPEGVTVDALGNLYIADMYNNCIRKVSTSGIITTIAGNGTAGFSGDGSQATTAELFWPNRTVFDASGNLYIADTKNNRVRKIDVSGIITTIVGNGVQGYSGDGGLATSAELYFPSGISFDASGNLYIADSQNNRIRKVTNVGQAGIAPLSVGEGQGVRLYPNPASTSLTLTLSTSEGKATIYMYDMLGQLVMQHAFSPPSEGQGEVINVSDLSKGVYFIKLFSGSTVYTSKFVKE